MAVQGESGMNFYEVKVYLDNKEVHSQVVRSKIPSKAVSNVTNNHYKGDMDYITVKKVTPVFQ